VTVLTESFSMRIRMPSSKRIISAALFCFPLAFCMAASVKADSTYSYVSPTLETFTGTGACPPNCHISLTMTLSAPLPPNLMQDIGGSGDTFPLSFSFTDGTNVWNNHNTIDSGFSFDTDSLGNITFFDVFADTSNSTVFAYYQGAANTTQIGSGTLTYSASVGRLGSPGGTWTLEQPTTTPEPSGLIMLGVGLLGLAGLAMKRSA
jgi:PEP-CTERM motif